MRRSTVKTSSTGHPGEADANWRPAHLFSQRSRHSAYRGEDDDSDNDAGPGVDIYPRQKRETSGQGPLWSPRSIFSVAISILVLLVSVSPICVRDRYRFSIPSLPGVQLFFLRDAGASRPLSWLYIACPPCRRWYYLPLAPTQSETEPPHGGLLSRLIWWTTPGERGRMLSRTLLSLRRHPRPHARMACLHRCQVVPSNNRLGF